MATELLIGPSASSGMANILLRLIEDGEAHELLKPTECSPRKTGNELLAAIAGEYDRWGMVAEARARLTPVLAADPNFTAVTTMVHVLMLEGKL